MPAMMMVILWFLAFLGVLIVVLSFMVGWKMTHMQRKEISISPESEGLRYEEVSFPSRTGDVLLDGWSIRTHAGARNHEARKETLTVIFSHGYGGNRLEEGVPALALARSLVERGYSVLMYDFRSCGRSGGTLTTVGYYEKLDVLGAVDWVKRNWPGERIALLGFSMGAVSSLLAAEEEPAVLGVIADSPFDEMNSYLRENLSIWSGLPKLPFTPVIMSILPLITGIKPNAVNCYRASRSIYPRPILFIHSAEDTAIPAACSVRLAQAHPDRFEVWITNSKDHVGSHHQNPKAYTSKLLDFLQQL